MKRLALWLLLVLVGPAAAEPKDAVVRIPSHGVSGTVIGTGDGWTLILSAGHGWNAQRDESKPPVLDKRAITIDVPMAITARKGETKCSPTLVGVDFENDVSLIQMRYGPLPHVAQVAPKGFAPGPCLSVGYDEMKDRVTIRAAHIAKYEGTYTYTFERPWHGRSGGALLDVRTGYLIGVVSGYTFNEHDKRKPAEVERGYYGVYAGHAAILVFLRSKGAIADNAPPAGPQLAPQLVPQASPWQPEPRFDPFRPPAPFYAPPSCPNGQCPRGK